MLYEISNYLSLKLRFYTCYWLHYYIVGIPYAWHSSLWSAGMAIMPMYIRVTYQKIGYLGHLWKFDRKWMQVSYQLFILLSCCEITWTSCCKKFWRTGVIINFWQNCWKNSLSFIRILQNSPELTQFARLYAIVSAVCPKIDSLHSPRNRHVRV